MLSLEEAQERVLSAFRPLESEHVSILEAVGRVLAEDVQADANIPPHANSSMDGFAVQAGDTAGAGPESPARLRVTGDLPAGQVPRQEVTPGTAIRIMTGAPLPPGADAVVKVEDTALLTEVDEEEVGILTAVKPGNYVRPAGEDVRKGTSLLRRGTRLRPQELGMLAALGRQEILVARKPRVAILATGDELVAIDEPLVPGKIRNTNSYASAAQVIEHGGEPILLGIARDRVEDLTASIRTGLEQNVDLFLTSGGVSVGDFDLVKDVLASEGEMHFWRVRMKPGKPLAFGHLHLSPKDRRHPSERGGAVPILGLPGNPVSVMVSFEMFIRPALLKMQGMTDWRRPTVEATLMDPIDHKDERRHFARVQLAWEDGEYRAHLTGAQGSGILSSMLKANALAVIPEEWDHAPVGARVQVMMLECRA
jgi:molybdopterin molybdotransferase